MSNSSFTSTSIDFGSAEPLKAAGATCDCYRMRLYGKLHFVKRLKAELAGNPRYKSMLQKEFETGYQLEHPNLIRYSLNGDDFIAMEYVDGENLTDFIRNHPEYFKKESHRRKFIRQLLDVTEYLHAHHVLHLDLKPDNIMMTRIGHDLKLVDLGFSYTDTFPDTSGHTKTFAAPEQLNEGGTPDERTDIFAIGKIMAVLPCTSGLKPVIRCCTYAEPEKRYQNVGEVRKALKRGVVKRRMVIAFCLLAVLAIPLWIILSQRPAGSSAEPVLQAEEVQKAEEADTLASEQAVIQDSASVVSEVTPPETSVEPEVKSTPTPTAEPSPIPSPITKETGKTSVDEVKAEAKVSEPEKSKKSVKEIIEEFKAEIRSIVIKMYDWHIAHGGTMVFQGKKEFWYNEQFVSLRHEYTDKYIKSIEDKLMKKYGGQLSEIDKYGMPEQFEIAITEVGEIYRKKLEEEWNEK